MDMLTAFCINGRGARCPKGEVPMTMTQNAAVYFEDKLDFENGIKPLLIKQMHAYKRLSHIGVLPTASSPLWTTQWRPVELNQSVYDRMIQKHAVDNDKELMAMIDKLCNEPLPNDLPLWVFHYIENNNGSSIWLWRISHGISDGIRLISVAANLLQDVDGNPIGAPTSVILKKRSGKKKGKGKKMNWLNPQTYLKLFADIKKMDYSVNGPCDSINAFKPDAKIHGPKRQIHIRSKVPLRIGDIKVLKNKFGVTFNDVITCLACSGIRAYILAKDPNYFKTNAKVTMTSLLAFGFPPKRTFRGQYDWLRNGFTMTDWLFPIGIADFEQRLAVIHKNGLKLKTSFVTPLAMMGTEFLARLGFDDLLDDNIGKTFARHTCVFSSLPSWDRQLYFEGVKCHKLEASYFNWIPQFIFISYMDAIYGTLIVDPERFPNAELIMNAMSEELHRQCK